MSKYEVQKLPDIEMYGGDTTPWELELVNDANAPFPYNTGSDCAATLTFTPVKTTTGMSANAVTVAPLVTKIGTANQTNAGGTSISFSFAESDTKHLRGKFLYQIEIRNGPDLRIGQGTLYIKQNINR